MAKRIGEILVEKGVITPEQLRASLRAQLVHGGHLGTCLIEMRLLDEETLGRVLAEIHRVEYATPAMFAGIPAPVIDLVSRRVVERRRVVPLRVEGKDLRVAMVNPGDLLAIDELHFASGMAVRPWVSPEVRIVNAMEFYYDVPRARRFLLLASSPQAWSVDSPRRSTALDRMPVIPLAATAPVASGGPTGVVRGSTSATQMAPLPALADPVEWSRIGTELFQHQPSPRVRPETTETCVDESVLLEEFEGVSDTLCATENPPAIAQAVLECAAHGLSRCILFIVRNLQARIWDWRGVGLDPATVAKARFPVDAEGIFELVAGSGWYRGAIPQQPSQIQFYRKLDLAVPTEALIVPVYFEERLVALLYGDGGDLGRVVGKTDLYLRLAHKMAIALNVLAAKRKLRQA